MVIRPLIVHELRCLLAALLSPDESGTVQAFITCKVTTMPFADFCRAVGMVHTIPSRDSATRNRSPEVSSTAFHAHPPDLRPASLMDWDFAIGGWLVPRSRLISGSCSSGRMFAPRFFQTGLTASSLRFANPSPPSGWVEDFHFRAVEHARHTTFSPLRRGEGSRQKASANVRCH